MSTKAPPKKDKPKVGGRAGVAKRKRLPEKEQKKVDKRIHEFAAKEGTLTQQQWRELDDELKIANEGASSYCYKRYKWLQKSKDKKGERHKRKRLGEEEQAQVDKRITEHVEKHPEMKQAEWHALDKSLGITNQGASSYSYKRHKWLCKADKLGKEKKVAAAAAAAAGATAAASKPKPKSKPKAKKEEPVPPRRRKKPRIVSA